jgi:ABC-type proline/glycine betaine transport system substrate-binding protein
MLLLYPVALDAQTTAPVAWQTISEGVLIIRPFANAPYPHASRADGYKAQGKTFPREPHYVDSSIGIFIPNEYAAGETVDYVVHFHGWGNHVSNAVKQFALTKQLADAKVNAILLVPQGPKDASDSGCGKLEMDTNGFKNLIEEVTQYLTDEQRIKTKTIGNIALSAHSGGYKVTGAILDHGGLTEHITDVPLLDASYGSLPSFAEYARGKDRRLVSLFTEHLADENQELMELLKKARIAYTTLDESMLKPEQFAARQPIFMATKLAHNDVPMKNEYFRLLLQTSQLARISDK